MSTGEALDVLTLARMMAVNEALRENLLRAAACDVMVRRAPGLVENWTAAELNARQAAINAAQNTAHTVLHVANVGTRESPVAAAIEPHKRPLTKSILDEWTRRR